MAKNPLSNISDEYWVKTLESNDTITVATITPDTRFEVKYVTMMLYISGAIGGSESLALKIYRGTKLLDTATLNLSDLEGLGTYEVSWLRFDFNRVGLYSGLEYTIKLTVSNYTRNGDTYYMGLIYDHSAPGHLVGDASTANWPSEFPYALRVFGNE